MPRQYIEIEEEPHPVMKYITFLCRTMGIITGIIFWWATIEILSTSESIPFIGWYMTGMVILYSFIEAIWLMDKCRCCEDDRGCCCTVWRIFLWIDSWRKTLIYVLIAVPMFMAEYRILYSLIAGGFLIFCGVFYFLKAFKKCHCGGRQKLRSRYTDQDAAERPEVASSHTQPPPPPANATDSTPLEP